MLKSYLTCLQRIKNLELILYAQYDKAKAHIFEANQKTKEDREKILSVLDLMNE